MIRQGKWSIHGATIIFYGLLKTDIKMLTCFPKLSPYHYDQNPCGVVIGSTKERYFEVKNFQHFAKIHYIHNGRQRLRK